MHKFLILLLAYIFPIHSALAQLIEVDFDKSMGIHYPPRYNLIFSKPDSKDLYNKYKALYEKNKFSKIPTASKPKIPKIIHQIWVGPNPIPVLYQFYQKTCRKLFADWEYKLWTDKDVEQWDFAYKKYYNEAQSYAEKADILRYEILYKYGGVYLDFDTECIKDFSELNYKYDLFVGIEPPTSLIGKPQISNAIIGTSPNNPILKDTLKIVELRWKENLSNFENMLISPSNFHILAIHRTMFPFAEAILNHLDDQQQIIALPATYFYPLHIPEFNTSNKLLNWINMITSGWFSYKPEDENFQGIMEESLTNHNFDKRYSRIPYVHFNDSMLNYQSTHLNRLPQSNVDKLRLISFSNNYNNILPAKVSFQLNDHIPPIIHHLWLKEQPIPSSIAMENFARLHPEWQVKIWTKNEVKTLPQDIQNFLPNLSLTQQEQLLSFAIIRQYGGVYADTCLNSLKSLTEFNNKYKFYAGLLPSYNHGNPLISSKLFAAKPYHVIIDRTVNNILSLPIDDELSKIDFSELFTANSFRFLALEQPNIIFPASYFYPLEQLKPKQSSIANLMLKLGLIKFNLSPTLPESFTSNENCQ